MSLSPNQRDKIYIERALALARKGLGRTSPNPMVGAIIVKNGKIVGEGFHKKAGAEHAEIMALNRAGESALGATLYLTLEPCVHYGKTPPCVDAILKAGISRAVISMTDPNPRVNGKGVAILRKGGIKIKIGVCENEAKKLNEAFVKFITTKRPFVTLKLAMTLDGRIADKTGASKWITSKKAREETHRLRFSADAILTGAGTVLKDDPLLTIRLKGEKKKNLRVILDPDFKLPETLKLWKTINKGAIVCVTAPGKNLKKRKKLEKRGIEFAELPLCSNGKFSLDKVLSMLAERDITSVLAECGARLSASLINARLVDKLALFIAPRILGERGLPAFIGEKKWILENCPALRFEKFRKIGEDIFIEAYPLWRTS